MSDVKSIPLTGKHGIGKEAIVDCVDYDKVLAVSRHWCLGGGGKSQYPVAQKGTKRKYLHRVVMDCSNGDGRIIDHINGDPLDNRRSNLRLCDPAGNARNSRAKRRSGDAKCVWRLPGGTWRAVITVNRKAIHLGCFSNKELAVSAYNDAARKQFGDFARLSEVKKEIEYAK